MKNPKEYLTQDAIVYTKDGKRGMVKIGTDLNKFVEFDDIVRKVEHYSDNLVYTGDRVNDTNDYQIDEIFRINDILRNMERVWKRPKPLSLITPFDTLVVLRNNNTLVAWENEDWEDWNVMLGEESELSWYDNDGRYKIKDHHSKNVNYDYLDIMKIYKIKNNAELELVWERKDK